jgi:hypothetical protein
MPIDPRKPWRRVRDRLVNLPRTGLGRGSLSDVLSQSASGADRGSQRSHSASLSTGYFSLRDRAFSILCSEAIGLVFALPNRFRVEKDTRYAIWKLSVG